MTTENGNATPPPVPASAPTPAAAAPVDRPWYESRIDGLTRDKYERDAEITRLKEENERIKAAAVPAPTPAPSPAPTPVAVVPPGQTKEEFDKAVTARAQEEFAIQTFNAKCKDVYDSGAKEFTDFIPVLENFKKLGGLPIPFVETVLELGNSAQIIYELGKNLDKASEMFRLSPIKQAIALQKFALELTQDNTISKAPPPVKPVVGAGGGKGSGDPEKMSMDEFVKWREGRQAS